MGDAAMLADLKYVVEDTDRHGNVRRYFRQKGKPKIRLHAAPGTAEFHEEYADALAGKTKPAETPEKRPTAKPSSFRWLCAEYYDTPEFKRMDKSTRGRRRTILDGICETKGDRPYKLLEAPHIRKMRDRKQATPEAANEIVKTLRGLYGWAVEALHTKANPAKEVPYLESETEGFHTWTVEEVEQYRENHPIGTKARLALELLLLTGVRRSDVVRFGKQMERLAPDETGAMQRWLRFTETKGRKRKIKEREILLLPQLCEVIDATPSEHLIYIVTEFGKPFTANGFGNRFRKWCDEAGLEHCTAHGLRKAGATIAGENGATELQLMSIFGWESPKQAALYTRKVNRKRLASGAMHLLLADQTENESVPLSGGGAKGGTLRAKK